VNTGCLCKYIANNWFVCWNSISCKVSTNLLTEYNEDSHNFYVEKKSLITATVLSSGAFQRSPIYGHIKSLNTSFHSFHYISDALNHSRYVHENQNGGILL
jgi:hypothetical protein